MVTILGDPSHACMIQYPSGGLETAGLPCMALDIQITQSSWLHPVVHHHDQ